MKRPLAALARAVIAFSVLVFLPLQGCKTGYHGPENVSNGGEANPPKCVTATANANVTTKTLKTFQLIAGLTCASGSYPEGFLSGQSVGYGTEINNRSNLTVDDPKNRSYARLIDGMDSTTTFRPAIVSVDYEYDQFYTQSELTEVNNTLEKHFKAGGIVSISWTPLNPWINDASDVNDRGSHENTLFHTGDNFPLADLLDNTKDVHTVWKQRLDAVAFQLLDLQTRGVPVLWQPLPEMNSPTYWWGTQASNPTNNASGAKLYTDVWKNMYDYFKSKGLNNLLWVYSPAESGGDNQAVDWAYPGESYTDIVAGIVENDQLTVKDYSTLVNMKKPVGLAKYGPSPSGPLAKSGTGTARGNFETTNYADRLRGSYPSIAYWVSNHSDLFEEGTRSNLALIDNLKPKELMERSYIYSLEKVVEKKVLE